MDVIDSSSCGSAKVSCSNAKERSECEDVWAFQVGGQVRVDPMEEFVKNPVTCLVVSTMSGGGDRPISSPKEVCDELLTQDSCMLVKSAHSWVEYGRPELSLVLSCPWFSPEK